MVNTLVSRHDKFLFGTFTGASNKALSEKDLIYVSLESSTSKENFYLLQTFLIPPIQ